MRPAPLMASWPRAAYLINGKGRVALGPAVYFIFIQPELTDMTLSPLHTAITFIGGCFNQIQYQL